MLNKILNPIKNFFTYLWVNKTKPKVFIPALIVIVIVLMFAFGKATAGAYELYPIEQKDFVQEVSVTGKVTPAQKVDLSFEVGGRISQIDATLGQFVKKGTVLARLSNAEYAASVQKSQAQYLSEQAKLAEVERGSRPEEIAIATSDVQTAQQNVDQAKSATVEQIKDSYAKSDDAIKGKADQIFRNPRSVNPELTFFIDGNSNLKSSIELQRLKITELFPKWQVLVSSIDSNTVNDAKVAEAKSYIQAVQNLLNDLNTALTSTGANLSTDTTFQLYRADISSARTSVNTALQSLNSAATTLRNNQSAYVRAQENLNLKKSGNTAEDIAAQRASAQSAAASVSGAVASLDKTIIVAPFDGVVTRIAHKVGESVSAVQKDAADAVITLMSDSAYEIETYVSENDAAKLKNGQLAKVTLDALGDAIVFDAVVSQVDLSETIKDGVVTYKTRLQFTTKDERIRSGLTANVVVETDKRIGVIKVPQSAIVITKGKKNVKVAPASAEVWTKVIDKQAKLTPVTTGAIDREGDIEIVSGVTVGSKVIVLSAVAE